MSFRENEGEGLEIDVSVRHRGWTELLPEAESLGRRAAHVAFMLGGKEAVGPLEASLVLADDAFMRMLNRTYRNRDEPTNVLSFATAAEGPHSVPAPGMPRVLGDIVVALETAAAEAAAERKALASHFNHLVVHGMLHLLGHDHETAAEAERMERLETLALTRLGVDDPYAAPARNRP